MMNGTITYTQVGDYQLPNIRLNEPPRELTEQTLGRYARMRKAFLKDYRQITYSRLLLTEKLFPHLREVEEAATARMEQVMNALAGRTELPDKISNPNAVVKRIQLLISEGRYMTRAELDRIPNYEKIMLARSINNFYHNLPEEYECPFPEKMDFYYPHESEWEAVRSFLNDNELIDATLSKMQYIFENTSTEDRYYNIRKKGYEDLKAFRDETYTLFPGIENLHDPETASTRLMQTPIISVRDKTAETSKDENSGGETEQLSLFDFDFPELPSVEEQQFIIVQNEQQDKQESETDKQITKSSSEHDDKDSILLNISNKDKTRITEQFKRNPRSREAVSLIKEIYGDINGIPVQQAIKRISELTESGAFNTGHDPDAFFAQVRDELIERGFELEDKIIKLGIVEYGELGDFQDVADYIENVLATEDKTVETEIGGEDELTAAAVVNETRADIARECEHIKEENGGVLVMRQVGDFFEMFGEDAEITASEFNFTIIDNGIGIPMTGFPRHMSNDYLKRLCGLGYDVAVVTLDENGSKNIVIHKAEQLEIPEIVAEIDFDAVANTVLERVMANEEYIEHLKTAESRSSLRKICSAVVERIISEHQTDEPNVFSRFNSDDDFNEDINNHVLRQSWLNKPKPEVADEISAPEPTTEQNEVVVSPSSPPPVFVVDWQEAQYDFDLSLYKDRDIIAYDKEGVQHALGQSGNITYVTSTGAFWGGNEVPGDIYEQINDYRDGKLTAEQVRENYLKVLADFKVQNEKAETEIKVSTAVDYVKQQIFDEPEKPQHAKPIIKGHNFRITDDHLGEGGAKTKFRNNINALKTLVNIESENRAATSEEQETLSRYVGWGGIQQAFDPDNKDWESEYRELKDLLTPDEWESARATVLNAHYTSPTVIKAIYETIERLGFKNERSAERGYNILEPACGVGNFFGLLPDSMKSSKLYGTEIDNVTARIAKYLYPNAEILNMPYENTQYSDAFFDIAIGNVPFGGYGVIDKRYKTNFNIHDYFFQKTLDKVRPGGIIAFVTSKGTLDKKNSEARKYIAQRAELLGAVRLPNNAFLKNAGTEATTDIIFLQKRDSPIDIGAMHLSDDKCDWVNLGLTDDGLPINRYFLDNPEMLLGRMTNESGSRMYGDSKSTTCEPIEGADLAEQLKTALSYVKGQYTLDEIDDMDGIDNNSIPADPNVKNFSYTEVDGKVYFRENSLMYPVDLPAMTLGRISGMIHLRDCVHELINLQLDEYATDETIKEQQTILNTLYDKFTSEFGLISSQANSRAFNADSAYYLLSSLEILDEDGNLERKADMFTKRTIKPKVVVTHVDTASEALAVSIGEKARVDIEYMSELTGFAPETLIKELEGVIFLDYGNPNRDLPPFDPDKMKLYEKYPLVTADEYLSGNVREKLQKAKLFSEVAGNEVQGFSVAVNIAALTEVQPKDLEPGEISARLGTTWIDAVYVEQFMHELLNTSWRNKNIYQVKYHKCTGEWQVTGKNKAQYSDINATVTYGTSRMNAYQIIDDTLNLRDVRIYDYVEDADGKERRVLNKKETMLAQQKQDTIKRKFNDWLWQDPERRQTLVKKYNELFNSTRTRQYDGSHITFSGMNPEIKLSKHQVDGAARYLYGGNTLYAHVVGAGKNSALVFKNTHTTH